MLMPEIIELFIEDQAFSLLYWLLSFQQVVSPSHSSSVSRSRLLAGEGGGGRGGGEGEEEPNHTTARKPGPLLII